MSVTESSEPQSEQTQLKQTPLCGLHLELGAKMVPFAGYDMPVHYPLGILQEHLHTRKQAGLFDVSHMGQIVVRGVGVAAALERLIPVDLEALEVGQQTYAVLTNEQGGILDDLIVTRWEANVFFLVVNAACKAGDITYLQQHLVGFELEVLGSQALLALQGPAAKGVMAELAPTATGLTFMHGCRAAVAGTDCYITRSGYTGEDGFEISVAANQAEILARALLAFAQVEAVGLGARDSLRLEAGLCLYGHDMNIGTSPVEASLTWSISKSRRAGGAKEGGFPGAGVILNHVENGVTRKRVGFRVNGRAPVREGAEIVDREGRQLGAVSSGGFAPTLNAPVAMGYVPVEYADPGTRLQALVRGKAKEVEVTKMPFVPQRYFRG